MTNLRAVELKHAPQYLTDTALFPSSLATLPATSVLYWKIPTHDEVHLLYARSIGIMLADACI